MPTLRILPLLLAFAPMASATVYHVENRDSAGLQAAIAHAAADSSEPHRIILAKGGLYTLTTPLPGRLGLPVLAGTIQIEGRGAEIRRYSSAPMTLLEVGPRADVRISDLTLAEGNLGAIRNLGTLLLERVTISDSSGEAALGIVVNHGDLTLSQSQLAYNEIHASGRDAGTVINFGRLILSDSAFVGNSLSRRYPSLAAAAVLNHGYLDLMSGHFADNHVLDDHGGLQSEGVLNLYGGRVRAKDTSLIRDERFDLTIN